MKGGRPASCENPQNPGILGPSRLSAPGVSRYLDSADFDAEVGLGRSAWKELATWRSGNFIAIVVPVDPIDGVIVALGLSVDLLTNPDSR